MKIFIRVDKCLTGNTDFSALINEIVGKPRFPL